MAFASNRDGGASQIYVMDADGANPIRVTRMESALSNPVWSPDGSRIAFYSDNGDKKDQIHTIQANGSKPFVVTFGAGHNIFPSWSPDGTTILFASDRDGAGLVLHQVAADGSNPRPIDGLKSFFARWSKDGSRIAYIAGTYPSTEIRIAPAPSGSHTSFAPALVVRGAS